MEDSHLVSAIRLPNNLFLDHAGTAVGSDFILLQKNSKKQGLSTIEKQFIESFQTKDNTPNNRLFENQKNAVLTRHYTDTDPYGQPASIYWHDGNIETIANDFGYILQKNIQQNFNQDLYLQQKLKQTQTIAVSSKEAIQIQEKRNEEPILTLYDLFNFTDEERNQNFKPKSSKKQKAPNGQKVIHQPKFLKVSKSFYKTQTVY
jgi:hypothetical protein